MPRDAFQFPRVDSCRSSGATGLAKYLGLSSLLDDIPRHATAVAGFPFPHITRLVAFTGKVVISSSVVSLGL
jgi:hypothetical protein